MRLISAVSGVQFPAPPPFFRHGVQEGIERARSAERVARKSTTHGSAEAPSPAAEGDGLAGRASGGQFPAPHHVFSHWRSNGIERAYGRPPPERIALPGVPRNEQPEGQASGGQFPAPPPIFSHWRSKGIERDWGADRLGKKRATHGSPAAPRPAAKAGALDGRRLRRAIPCTAPVSRRGRIPHP